MARHGRGGGQGPVKGFRPGKEPPQLKKQRALQQFGDVSATQERLIEMFSERTPDESRRLMGRWRAGLLTGAVVLALLGGVLFRWTAVGGIILMAVALGVFFVWWRLRSQREALESMADAVSGRGRGRGKGKSSG